MLLKIKTAATLCFWAFPNVQKYRKRLHLQDQTFRENDYLLEPEDEGTKTHGNVAKLIYRRRVTSQTTLIVCKNPDDDTTTLRNVNNLLKQSTWRNIPGYLNLQQHCRDDITYRNAVT